MRENLQIKREQLAGLKSEQIGEGTTVNLRPEVFSMMDELSHSLEVLLQKYASGGEVVTEEGEGVVDKVYAIVDSCILFSEYCRAIEIFDKLEKQYPKAIEDSFRDIHQHNPIPGLRAILMESRTPLETIHKTKKEKEYLGYKNRNTDRSDEEYKDLLGLTEEEIRGEKILDVGAGSAVFAEWAKRSGVADIFSIDVNSKVADVRADWQRLPFKDESFDRAVSVFAFPLWVKNWQEMEASLREIVRVIKKGGKVQLIPGAPVLDWSDIDVKTRNRWKKLECDMRDTINRPEFEKVLMRFKDEVEIFFGEPKVDLDASHSTSYTPLTLRRR